MRAVQLIASLLLTGATALAQAGAFDTCTQKDAQPQALRTCVEGERNRAANLLREANQSTLAAVNQKVRDAGHKADLRSFRVSQSQHVRHRATQCRKVAGDLAGIGCEADADFAQIAHLKQMTAETPRRP